MPSTNDYGDLVAGKLAARLASGTTSGATVTAQSVNGSVITWPTGAHRLKLYRKTKAGVEFETIGVASASQSGSTVTLGTLTRQMSMTDGSTFSSGGDGRTFPANTDVYLSWDVFDAERTMKDDKVNTITGSGAIRGSSTTTPIIRLNNVTTAQRTAMSPGNGDMVYDTDLGELYQYKGGAWAAVGDTGTAAATTTSLGTAEKGTTADIRAETATGDGGGPLFIPTDATAVLKDDRIVLKDATELTIASGAITVTQAYHSVDTESDAASDDLDTITAAVGVGEIIVLVANNTARTVVVKHNTGNIKLADAADFSLDDTEKSITLLKQASNWIEISRGRGVTSSNYAKVVALNTTDSSTLGASSTSDFDFNNHQYTIPANDLINGVAYEIEATITLALAAGNIEIFGSLGSTKVLTLGDFVTPTSGPVLLRWTVFGTEAAGSSVTVKASGEWTHIVSAASKGFILYSSTSSIASNGSLVLKMGGAFRTSNGSNSMIMRLSKITKLSTSAF